MKKVAYIFACSEYFYVSNNTTQSTKYWSMLFPQTHVSNADSLSAALSCLYCRLKVSWCCCVLSEHGVNDGTYKFSQATEGENSASLLWCWKHCCKSSNIFAEFFELLCSTGFLLNLYWRKITAPGNLWIIAFCNSTRKKACKAGVPHQAEWQSSIVRHRKFDELNPHLSPTLE